MKSKIIGLTGGIATGKSTVSRYLNELGYPIIDADVLVHRLQKRGGRLYNALLSYYGHSILNEHEEIDRQKLAVLIFSSKEGLRASDELQDAIIREALWQEKEGLNGKYPLIFMDIPLLFEKDYASWCDEILVVYVSPEIQQERLMKRNYFSREEALSRITSQISIDEKCSLASYVLDNQGSFEETKASLDNILQEMCYNGQETK